MFVKTQTTEERFWAKVDKSGECWLWTGTTHPVRRSGYLWVDGKNCLAHRVVWELENGPIPAGAEIHHKCHNRQCVNPDHLELMASHREHWLRTQWEGRGPVAENAVKTHCIHGHPLSGDNLIELVANAPTRKGPMRKCRTCEVARHKRRDAKKKAARHAARAAREEALA